eukprot:GDKJ01030060.1.p1 GENE.GDKJ01030060.1~~GDKJ01030060.1.p1  ORF type:complete len:380 (+),score=119.39 GDKJ01030060.1:1-1140(+)
MGKARMATARPLVTVAKLSENQETTQVRLPAVFSAPIRPDLVRIVHTNMNKNRRQAHGVAANAGYQSSAESWGTGRAVARIPRVSGGGTHRAGQGAFGNQCRGGGMFNPLKTWRRWHRHTNKTAKRHAVAAALAASAVPAVVMARGHKIDAVKEIPLVLPNSVESITKTKQAVEILSKIGAIADVQKAKDSKHIRCGVGKTRGRRYVARKGPLVVYGEDNGIVKAVRNLPGVEVACVDRLNLLQLAPGGSLGRFVIFTEGAFRKLAAVYGNYKSGSLTKSKYHLPRSLMANADLARIINGPEIQSVIRPAISAPKFASRKNAITNKKQANKINPAAVVVKKINAEVEKKNASVRKGLKKVHNKSAHSGRKHMKTVLAAF